ncbi:MAG: electron transfer flavoprotein subunit beta/FixA family protein [Syntrophomonadaceae bacterium]|nr:electron transfer flavoprotein subunit beta/FixA family protein [Syntrophomonadaceae bacterium]
MPNILCCFKWVADEAYIRASAGKELDLEWVDYKISDYDRNAIEEAVRLQEQYGGNVSAITVGKPDDTKGLKDALSRGPEKAYFINDSSFQNLEPSQTAAILAEVIKSQIDYDLIICGEGSSDLYAQQVGPRLAEILSIPCVSFIQKLDIEQNQLIVERKVDDGVEVLSLPMPALVTVLPDINSPRIPGLKDTLSASRKPVVDIGRDDLSGNFESCLQTMAINKANMERNGIKLGSEPQDISQLVDALVKQGVIGGVK